MAMVAIEPTDKTILGIRISIERNMLVAEQFIQSLIRRYGKTQYFNRWMNMVSSTSM
jgi:transposase-like protein